MDIIPAIDIKGGVCVRLYQGNFHQETIYGTDPVEVAQRWVAQGATRLHVVDLDGARAGYPINTEPIKAIIRAVAVPVQLGGGLRSEEHISAALAMGVERVILGTVAVREPGLVQRAVDRFAEAIIVGVDARGGQVATAGWIEQEHLQAIDLVDQMAAMGVQRIVYTDITRDGTLTEPNFPATAALIRPAGPAIIASGGIAHVTHLVQLASIGVEGAIIGRALYTGAIALPEAIASVA